MPQPDRQDDATIRDTERLFRRVHLKQLVRDDDTGLARVSSGAFKDRELSIHIESVLAGIGRSAEWCLQGYGSHKLVSITAGDARALHQIICRDPLVHDPSHGLVCGSKNNRKTSEGLRSAAIWVVPPGAPLHQHIEAEKQILGF